MSTSVAVPAVGREADSLISPRRIRAPSPSLNEPWSDVIR